MLFYRRLFFPSFFSNKRKHYYCKFIHKNDKDKILKLIKECESFPSIIPIEDLITIDDITYIFFERAETIDKLYSIDEKKLIELFIELCDINNPDNINLITSFCLDRIVFKDEKYKIDLLSVFNRKAYKRSDLEIITYLIRFFDEFNLKKISELKK